jgi:shikimate dehydrogenase
MGLRAAGSAADAGQKQLTRELRLGLIGAGIQRSRTPSMHAREAAAHGWSCRYALLDLDVIPGGAAALPSLIDRAERHGYAGLNITHPCKEAVLQYVTALSDDARKLRAVNAIVFAEGARIGCNTDWWGFRESVARGLEGVSLSRVVQLGAGGAGAATAYAALQLGVARLDIVDVVGARAEALVERMNALFPGRAFACANPAAALPNADGLIHATPTGMVSHPGLPLAGDLIEPRHWVAEIVYFPLETELLRVARQRGCRTLDGTGMALWQAVEAFRLFTGVVADSGRMRGFFDEAANA